MEKELVVEEKYSNYWFQITVALLLSTLLFFVAYTSIDNILWKSYLRLIAFGCLAGTVFSILKVMQGKYTVRLGIEDEKLVINYLKNEKTVHRDFFDLNSIDQIYPENNTTFVNAGFLFNDINIRFLPRDSERPLNLLEVNGRPLPFSSAEASQIIKYILKIAPNVSVPEGSKTELKSE